MEVIMKIYDKLLLLYLDKTNGEESVKSYEFEHLVTNSFYYIVLELLEEGVLYISSKKYLMIDETRVRPFEQYEAFILDYISYENRSIKDHLKSFCKSDCQKSLFDILITKNTNKVDVLNENKKRFIPYKSIINILKEEFDYLSEKSDPSDFILCYFSINALKSYNVTKGFKNYCKNNIVEYIYLPYKIVDELKMC
jgi:hypothetical protein